MVKNQLHSLNQVRFLIVVLYGALFSVCVVWFFQRQENQSSLFSKFAKSKPINYWQFEDEDEDAETPQQTTMLALGNYLAVSKFSAVLQKMTVSWAFGKGGRVAILFFLLTALYKKFTICFLVAKPNILYLIRKVSPCLLSFYLANVA